MASRLATVADVFALALELNQTPFSDWRLTITGSSDGTYTVTINATPFPVVAVAQTVAQIRDALVAAINGGAEPVTAIPDQADQIVIVGDAGARYSLAVASTGDPISAAQPLVDTYLELTACKVSTDRFETCTSQYHALLTAHSLTLLPICAGADGVQGQAQGPLGGEADGPASRSFQGVVAFDATAAGLDTTPYGREALMLRKRFRGRGSAIVANRAVPQQA